MRDPLRRPNKKWRPSDGWCVADSSSLETDPMVAGGDRLLPWNSLPETVDPSLVDTLRVYATETSISKGLPPYTTKLTHLVDLVVPGVLIPSLRQESLPNGLRRLGVNPVRGTARFPAEAVFPTIEEVYSPHPIVFEPRAFPSLRFLHLRLDRRKTMLDRLSSLESLKALGLGPFNDAGLFRDLRCLEIDWFAAYGTRSVESIEGIGYLKHLDAIRIFEFPRLTSLVPLRGLPSLSELEIAWCPRIQDFEVLLDMPSLKRVEFYFCNQVAVNAIRPALEARGVFVHPPGTVSVEH
jgi:hypothetical protein